MAERSGFMKWIDQQLQANAGLQANVEERLTQMLPAQRMAADSDAEPGRCSTETGAHGLSLKR